MVLPEWASHTKIELVLNTMKSWHHVNALKERLFGFLSMRSIQINKQTLTVKCEARPDRIPLNRAAARSMKWLSSRGLNTDKGVGDWKPKWHESAVSIRHVLTQTDVAIYYAEHGWSIDKVSWERLIPEVPFKEAVFHLS